MEATIIYWDSIAVILGYNILGIGIMEKNMETTGIIGVLKGL